MSINTASAVRVATTIATFKWIAVGGILLVGVIGLLGGFASGDGSGVLVGLLFFVGAALYALVAWVLFGWFEQTLRLLAAIAENTAPAYPGGMTPDPYSR